MTMRLFRAIGLISAGVRAIGGGVAIDVPNTDDSDAPRLILDGVALLGGVSLGARAAEPAFDD